MAVLPEHGTPAVALQAWRTFGGACTSYFRTSTGAEPSICCEPRNQHPQAALAYMSRYFILAIATGLLLLIGLLCLLLVFFHAVHASAIEAAGPFAAQVALHWPSEGRWQRRKWTYKTAMEAHSVVRRPTVRNVRRTLQLPTRRPRSSRRLDRRCTSFQLLKRKVCRRAEGSGAGGA
jgi:hypothetical protein